MSSRGFWLLLVLLAGCSLSEPAEEHARADRQGDPAATERAVRNVLDAQVEAWNRGDIEGFMDGYLDSERLRFASGGRVHYGWQATLERYRNTYPDRAAMGALAFTDLDVQVLGEERALVFGRFELVREGDRPHGLFTLILERRQDGWRVVHDHTSAATP